MDSPSGSRMALALKKNIGTYAWLYRDVLRLRTKSDSVVDSVSEGAVRIRRAKGVGGIEIPFANLTAVALPRHFAGSDLGKPVPSGDVAEADMVLVTDAPFESVWQHIQGGGEYFWRDSKAFDVFNRMFTVNAMMAYTVDNDEEQSRQQARQLVDMGRHVARREPSHEEPMVHFFLGSAYHVLEELGAEEEAYRRALELQVKRDTLDEPAVTITKRRLGLLLGLRGVQTDDSQLQRNALELLEQLPLEADEPVFELRQLLRNAVRTVERNPVSAPSGSDSQPVRNVRQSASDKSDRGCFVATAVYGSPLANEVEVLRRFRDQVLIVRTTGRVFVAVYYTFSPCIARLTTRYGLIRQMLKRMFIAPALFLARRTLRRRPWVVQSRRNGDGCQKRPATTEAEGNTACGRLGRQYELPTL